MAAGPRGKLAYNAAFSGIKLAKPPGMAMVLLAAIGQKVLEPDMITYTLL